MTASTASTGTKSTVACGKRPRLNRKQPVGPELQEHPGQQDRTGGRGLDVGVGKPGVQREDRDLDREGECESGEEPSLGRRVQGQVEQLGVRERGRTRLALMDDRQGDDGGQHQGRTEAPCRGRT